MTDETANADTPEEPVPTELLGHDSTLDRITTSVGTQLMKAWYEQMTQQRTMWAVTPSQEQQSIIDRMRDLTDMVVGSAVRQIASGGFLSCAVRVEQLTVKEDGAKASFTLLRGSPELHDVMDRVGASAVLVFISPDQFYATRDAVTASLDQAELPLGDD